MGLHVADRASLCSDDRSAATVTDRIQNAIDAGSGLKSRGKPICVVIDEIDGAAGGGDTVRWLASFSLRTQDANLHSL